MIIRQSLNIPRSTVCSFLREPSKELSEPGLKNTGLIIAVNKIVAFWTPICRSLSVEWIKMIVKIDCSIAKANKMGLRILDVWQLIFVSESFEIHFSIYFLSVVRYSIIFGRKVAKMKQVSRYVFVSWFSAKKITWIQKRKLNFKAICQWLL
jgi:hypothetical protein